MNLSNFNWDGAKAHIKKSNKRKKRNKKRRQKRDLWYLFF